MKVLLLGSSGMLGKSMYNFLSNDFKIYTNGLRMRKYDLCQKNDLLILLNNSKPNVIINSSGITNIEICEKNKKLAKKINAEVLKNLFELKKKYNHKFWVIQISTDQMYDSASPKKNFSEKSKTKINNYYTKTKLEAERTCKKNKSLILRTNFFGKSTTHKKSFSDWILQQMRGNKLFYLFKDVYFSPLRMISICKIVKKILLNDFGKTGIYNLGSKNGLSKLKFSLIFSNYLKIKNNNYRAININKVLKIKRSRNMLMNVKKFENSFKIRLPDLRSEIKDEINENYLS